MLPPSHKSHIKTLFDIALVLAEIELISLIVAGMSLCFGFRRKVMLITH